MEHAISIDDNISKYEPTLPLMNQPAQPNYFVARKQELANLFAPSFTGHKEIQHELSSSDSASTAKYENKSVQIMKLKNRDLTENI
jgi:hypothetical protein